MPMTESLIPVAPGKSMKAREIARIAGISINAVYQRYNAGLRGAELLRNVNEPVHTRGDAQCIDCGKWFKTDKNHLVVCPHCLIW